MNDCSKHKKEVAGITSMVELAGLVSDLHYESLTDFLAALSSKISIDGDNDFNSGRKKIGRSLYAASYYLEQAQEQIREAWKISQPFMENNVASINEVKNQQQ